MSLEWGWVIYHGALAGSSLEFLGKSLLSVPACRLTLGVKCRLRHIPTKDRRTKQGRSSASCSRKLVAVPMGIISAEFHKSWSGRAQKYLKVN